MEAAIRPYTIRWLMFNIYLALRTSMDFSGVRYGRRGGNRTHNPRLRRPVLYPIELLAHVSYCSCEVNEARGVAGAGVSAATSRIRK